MGRNFWVLTMVAVMLAAGQAVLGVEANLPADEGKAGEAVVESEQAQAVGEETAGEDVNKTGEPNVGKEPNELDLAIEGVKDSSEDEVRRWVQDGPGAKMSLAKAVQEQVAEELTVVRRIAQAEGATKTVEMIDRLIEARRERYEKITSKMEKDEQKEEERERKRAEREERRRERTEGTRSRDKGTERDRETKRRERRTVEE